MRYLLLLLSLNSSIAFAANSVNCRYLLGGDSFDDSSFQPSGSPQVTVDAEGVLIDLTQVSMTGLSTTGSPEDKFGQTLCEGNLELILPFFERSRLTRIELLSATSEVTGDSAESTMRVKGEVQAGSKKDGFEKVWIFGEEQNFELFDQGQNENTSVCGNALTLRLKLLHGTVIRGDDSSQSARLSVPFVRLRFAAAPEGDRACVN